MTTIVGYFDDYEKAAAVVGELVARCFGPEAIEIGRAAKEKKIEEENEQWLFDKGVRAYYPADAREESAFVAVSVSENDTRGVSHVMGHHGAFCVEEWPTGRQGLF